MDAAPATPPIHLVVHDDLRRHRLTVFFRPLLALPHLFWLVGWCIAASFAAFLYWIVVLIDNDAPEGLRRFLAAFLRYSVHVSAFVLLAANPFPGFLGRPGYPVDIEVAPPERQRRWGVGFRFVLAVPAILLGAALGNWLTWAAAGFGYFVLLTVAFGGGVATITAVLAWFAALVTGRAPRGLRDLTAYALGHGVSTGAYALVLTERYPSSDPRLAEEYAELPALEVTRNPDALEGVMVGFTETSLHDPDPPAWVRHLLGTHPELVDRVAMARAWESRNRP